MIGTELGHYKLLEKLGHGGMGEVYAAEDTRLKRQVALKVLTPAVAGDAEAMARFRREAEAVAALNHPNIVTIHSVEEVDDVHFLTMELVEGRTLDGAIPEGGLELERVFEIAIPLADALSTAHERGIVHRDLKPANVMVTPEGRVKVLDFGLAKLLDEPADEPRKEATAPLTEAGRVMGTVPYMSPEQVQGKPLDIRTDIFSLGVMLYEMATGRRPFGGETSADLISSILRDTPESVTEVKLELPFHLGRIVRHCLEKDPSRRYQSALDVRNELAALRREVESGVVSSETLVAAPATPAAPKRRSRRRTLSVALVAAAAVAALAAAWWLLGDRTGERPPEPAVAASPADDLRPSIAVLYFDNLSGDPELEWLRSGLTDMLVTDLSQSPDLRVLSTNRLHQILAEMRKLDERIESFEVVQDVAQRAGAGKVISGSFAKLGETIRISINIQEASTGEILRARSVDAPSQDQLFARIDELSREIRSSIELPERPQVASDRNLEEVSTSSVVAYRRYVEAEKLHNEGRDQEAIPLYRQAVEEDPSFAMAWAKLSTVHGNLRLLDDSRRYAEKAMEHLERLTEPERAYVEGRYYGQTLATTGRAIETYSKTLERYPHLTALANNLAVLYSNAWLLDEAAATYEQSIRYGDDFPGTHHGLASAYLGLGEERRAVETLEAFLEEHPDSFGTHAALANLWITLSDLERAEAALDRTEELRPGYIPTLIGRYQLALLRGELETAAGWAERFGELPFPFAQSGRDSLLANLDLHRGRSAEALQRIDKAISYWPEPGPNRALNHLQACATSLLLGDPASALVHAGAAREDDPGNLTDYISHALQAVAQQQLGQSRRADLLLDELEQRVETIPGPVGRFTVAEARGWVAYDRGNHEAAARQSRIAADIPPHLDLNRPRLLFSLAQAQLALGRDDEAERRLREIAAMGWERIFQPVIYVRSHYLLARLLEEQGREEEAETFYRSFLERWGDGDVDREEIARAREFLARAGDA